MRAVHLKLIVDLSTSTFIRALYKFIVRRGKCASIYSDNAKNFINANNQLREVCWLVESRASRKDIGFFSWKFYQMEFHITSFTTLERSMGSRYKNSFTI